MTAKDETVNSWILEQIVQDKPVHEMLDIYKEWAKNYDDDILTGDYQGPFYIVNEFNKLNYPKDARVVDVGCGTGLVGQQLKNFGYYNIDALDGTEEMLDQAKKKNIYKNYIRALVLEDKRLPIEDNTYDAMVCVGAIVPGHIGIDDLFDVLRIVKPGGVLCFTISFNYGERKGRHSKAHVEQVINKWIDEGRVIFADGYPKVLDGYTKLYDCTVYVLRVL